MTERRVRSILQVYQPRKPASAALAGRPVRAAGFRDVVAHACEPPDLKRASTGPPADGPAGLLTFPAVLVECAHGAARTGHCQFQKYHKALTVRRGYKRAIVATAHKILRCVFAVLRDGTPCRDPATDYEELLVKRNAPRWLRKLREFGIFVHNDDGAVSVCWPPSAARTIPVH